MYCARAIVPLLTVPQEVYALDWNLVYKDTFLSGSYDTSIKWWSPARETSLQVKFELLLCILS